MAFSSALWGRVSLQAGVALAALSPGSRGRAVHSGVSAGAVVLPIVGHQPFGSDVLDAGVADGDTVGVASDVLEHLLHALCRWTAVNDPVFRHRRFPDILRDGRACL